MRVRGIVGTTLLVGVGYACGTGGAGDAIMAAANLIELNGGSLAQQLAEAGSPRITAGFGIAERVPEDGTRHFTLTVATENRAAANDSAALYALMDAHEAAGPVWGANVLAFAHSDMRGGAVQGLEVDVGNLGTTGSVPVAGVNVFAIGAKPSDVAVGILNGTGAGPGGFREGIAFHSTAPGVAVTEALVRVHPDFGSVVDGVDLRNAHFSGVALATPGFTVDGAGAITSTALAIEPTDGAYVCVDHTGKLFASVLPCGRTIPLPQDEK